MAAPASAGPKEPRLNTANALTWFEIPVRDLDRAQRFYEQLLGAPMKREQMGSQSMAIFAYQPDSGVGGCLAAGPEERAPADQGTLVYLRAAPTLDAVLARLPAAGGRLVWPKTALPEGMGVFAHVLDSEGNLGLHAPA
jgi:predicted enzyme related to lactoylglutathione lyase